MNLETIQRNYAAFNDSKIEHLAKYEAASLEPEVLPILKDEIKKRGLDLALLNAVDAQTQTLTAEQLSGYRSRLVGLKCPECGKAGTPLMGILIREVASYAFLTSYKRRAIIACPVCAETAKKDALKKTLLLGWWSIPSGFIQTPRALISSWIDGKRKDAQSELILTEFIIQHLGEMEANAEKDEELITFIRDLNSGDYW